MDRLITESKEPSDVLFIGDDHSDPNHRLLIYCAAKALKSSGFTHYLIEGSASAQPVLDQLGKGTSVELRGRTDIGPGSFGDKSFSDAVYAMADAGMKVIAIDTPGEPAIREHEITKNIQGVLKEGGKPVVLIGQSHATSTAIFESMPSVAKQLSESGYKVKSLLFPVRSIK